MGETIICGEGRMCEASCPFYRPGQPCPSWAQLAVELAQHRVQELAGALDLDHVGIVGQ